MAKKGMPRPPISLCRDAEDATFLKLTGARELPVPDYSVKQTTPLVIPSALFNDEPYVLVNGRVLSKSSFSDFLGDTVSKLFKNSRFQGFEQIEPFLPSTSSNYTNTRSLGGCVGTIMDHPSLLEGLKSGDLLCSFRDVMSKSTHNGVISYSSHTEFDYTNLSAYFSQFMRRVVDQSKLERPVVKPLGLSEALKTRVITQGPPILYTAMRPLQQFLLRTIQRLDVFRLTGEKVTEEFLNSQIEHPGKVEFYSIDYSDATNDLYSWCSEVVLLRLFNDGIIDSETYHLARKSMTGHVIELNLGRREGKEFLVQSEQQRGQLMGSILSFPILCIINFAICLKSLQACGHDIHDYKKVPIIINGDDGLVWTSHDFFPRWANITKLCGMTPSVGKVYRSRDYFNINSRSFIMTPAITIVPYINMAIVNDLRRSQNLNDRLDGPPKSFGTLCTELLDGSPDDLKVRVMGQFLWKNRLFLQRLSIPWFLPEHLLGLGFPSIGKYRLRSNDASFIPFIDNYKRPSLACTGWRCREYALNRFPRKFTTSYGENVLSFDNICSILSVEALFRLKSIKDLYTKGNTLKTTMPNYHYRLNSLWKKIRKDHPFDMKFVGLEMIDSLLKEYNKPPSFSRNASFAYVGRDFEPPFTDIAESGLHQFLLTNDSLGFFIPE